MTTLWIQTSTGRRFYPGDPRAADVDIVDIAHALSQICRFNGHSRLFYSVAEHCVNVCEEVQDPKLKLHALLHDAHEAYIGDVTSPVKRLPEMRQYKLLEQRLWAVIAERFGLSLTWPPEVKRADLQLLADEAGAFWDWHTVESWQLGVLPRRFKPKFLAPWAAKNAFLAEYQRWR